MMVPILAISCLFFLTILLLISPSSGFHNITIIPFNKIQIQASEAERLPLSAYFKGQKLVYSTLTPNLTINKEWREDSTCPRISARLGKSETISQLSIYEDVQHPFPGRVLYVATNLSHFYRVDLECNNSAKCAVIACNYKAGAQYFAWGQIGEKFLHILFQGERLAIYVQSATELICSGGDAPYWVSFVPDIAVPLDETKIIVVQDRLLSIIQFAPSERVLYVNLSPFTHQIQQVLVTYPRVITLESVSNEVRILRYDPSYEDLFPVSRFSIMMNDSIHQLFLSLYEPDILVAVAQNSDAILLYDVSSGYTPRLVKSYFDPDFVVPTSLPPAVSRIAVTCDYIAILAGDYSDLILRVIHKGREQQNYIVDDIRLGTGHSSVSLTMLDYYANRFMLALERETRVFAFADGMLTLVGERLSQSESAITYVIGQITATGTYVQSKSTVYIVVYPYQHQFSTMLRENTGTISWIGYEGHLLTVDLTKYYFGSAVSVKEIRGDNNTYIEKQDKIQFTDKLELSWSNNYYSCLWNPNGNIMVAQVETSGKRFAAKYCELTRFGQIITRTVASINYEKEFHVLAQAFSEDLRKVFIHVRFQLTDGAAYLLYYTGYDAKTIYFVTEMDLGGLTSAGECTPVKLHYQESANYIFSAVTCELSGGIYGSVTRFKLSPSSPTTILTTNQFKIKEKHLVDVYVGSDIYSAYITSRSTDTRYNATLTFTEPYFQNEGSIVNYELTEWNFIGAQYSSHKLVLFLEDKAIFSNVIKEFSIPTASTPVHRRDLHLPLGHTFVKDEEDGNVISDMDGEYLGVITQSGGQYCFFIFDLKEIGLNSLYDFNCDLKMSPEDPPTIIDLLRFNEGALYVLVYTKHQIYRYVMSTTYDLSMKVLKLRSQGNMYISKFNVTVQSPVYGDLLKFEVMTIQIPRPPIFNVSKAGLVVKHSVTDLSKAAYGYDLFVSLNERREGIYVKNREFETSSKGARRDVTLLAEDVDSVLPLEGGDLVFTKNLNNLNIFEANRGETQLQVVPELADVRIVHLHTEGQCSSFVIFNTGVSAEKEQDKLVDNEVPQIRYAVRCLRRNFVYSKKALRFDRGAAQFSSIENAFFDEINGLLYVILNPRRTFHFVRASHYIAVVRLNNGTLTDEPEYVVTEKDLVEVAGHLRIAAAALVDTTMYLALEGEGLLLSLRYSQNGDANHRVEVSKFPIKGEDARFKFDRKIVRLFYNKQQTTLYILYRTSGLIYVDFSVSMKEREGGFIYHMAPLVDSKAHFSGIYADGNLVLVSGTAMEGEVVYAFTWLEKRLIPQWRFLYDICRTNIDSLWLDSTSVQEFPLLQSFRIYVHCDSAIYATTVQKHAELHVDFAKLPVGNTYTELILMSSAGWNLETLGVTIVKRAEDQSYLTLWIVLSGLLIALAVGVGTLCWCRYSARARSSKELEAGFLFNDTKMERSRSKYVSGSKTKRRSSRHGSIRKARSQRIDML